ncbi:MAG: hypothetical protein ABJM26_22795 [Anderseniella sp.]|uniref:hypothetical protein n=1 Tax=Parasphingorhabdus sp. TaxID=2709688 RepID=UPI003290DCDC
MKNPIPEEIIALYGTIAVSRIARKKTKMTLEKLPKVQKILKKSSQTKTKMAKSIADFDVESGGMSDEFEDFMREGFLCLIPDEDCPDPDKWRGPDLPPGAFICAEIRIHAENLLEEFAIQSQVEQQLEMLVAALDTNSHPLIQLFAVIFKTSLEQTQERLEEIGREFASLVQAAEDNDCPYPVFTL